MPAGRVPKSRSALVDGGLEFRGDGVAKVDEVGVGGAEGEEDVGDPPCDEKEDDDGSPSEVTSDEGFPVRESPSAGGFDEKDGGEGDDEREGGVG